MTGRFVVARQLQNLARFDLQLSVAPSLVTKSGARNHVRKITGENRQSGSTPPLVRYPRPAYSRASSDFFNRIGSDPVISPLTDAGTSSGRRPAGGRIASWSFLLSPTVWSKKNSAFIVGGADRLHPLFAATVPPFIFAAPVLRGAVSFPCRQPPKTARHCRPDRHQLYGAQSLQPQCRLPDRNTYLDARTVVNATLTLSDLDKNRYNRLIGRNLRDKRYLVASQILGNPCFVSVRTLPLPS